MAGRTDELSQTEAALLAFLAYGEASGYDLARSFEGMQLIWAPARGHMYAILPRLVEQGWATSREAAEGRRPPKQIYRITRKGRAALKRWLERPIEPEPDRNILLVKLMFGDLADTKAMLGHVRDRRVSAQKILGEINELQRASDESGEEQGVYPWLTRHFGLLWAQMMIQWADDAERTIRAARARPGGPLVLPRRR